MTSRTKTGRARSASFARARRLAAVLSLGMLTNCRAIEDSGYICLHPSDVEIDPYVAINASTKYPSVTFAPGAPIRGTAVVFHSGGNRLRDLHCSLARDGFTIHASSFYRDPPGDPSDLLASTIVECSLDPLPTGTYTVFFGPDERELVIPSTVRPLCLGVSYW